MLAARRVFAILPLAALALVGCSHDTMLLESDVPVPQEMTTVRSADIRRSGGTVSGGSFLLAGDVENARRSVTKCAKRFDENGWKTVKIDGNADASTAIFTKDTRTAELTLRRRSLEPRMSNGLLTMQSSTKAPTQKPNP